MLFPAGKRPTRAALNEFAQAQQAVSLTHDPAGEINLQLVDPSQSHPQVFREPSDVSATRDPVWVELLREGLTFDLMGLAPGSSYDLPACDHLFDLETSPTAFRTEALFLTPGPHLTGGQRSLPVMQGLLEIARDLVHHFEELEAVIWPPSGSAIGRVYFESVAAAWLEGGAFPAPGLIAFKPAIDGALETEGLDYWIDQELRIEPPLSNDRLAATRLAVRLVNRLVILGNLRDSERMAGPDGRTLVLRPSENRKFVRVWQE
ncbi:MAG: hypothetical protein AAFW59_05240 [Pseudomonadota bacterium]